MNTFQQVVILKAGDDQFTNESNRQRNLNLESCISDCHIIYNKAEYVGDSSGDCLVTLPRDEVEFQALIDLAFDNFKQDEVFYQDASGLFYKVENTGEKTLLGKLRQSTSNVKVAGKEYIELNGNLYEVRS